MHILSLADVAELFRLNSAQADVAAHVADRVPELMKRQVRSTLNGTTCILKAQPARCRSCWFGLFLCCWLFIR